MPSRLLRQERIEQCEDLTNRASQLGENWNHRFTLDNRRLVERYINSELWILMDLVFILTSGKTEQYRAIFNSAVGGSESYGGHNDGLIQPWNAHPELQDERLMACPHCEQKSMLVDYVKLMEPPQSVVPSFVRLESKQHLSCRRSNTLSYSHESGFKLVSIIGDDERVTRSDRLSVRLDKLTPHEVQSRTKIVDRISRDRGKAGGRRSAEAHVVLQVSRLRIYLADEFIGVALMEPLDPGFQLTDVLIGPLDLQPWTTRSALSHKASLA